MPRAFSSLTTREVLALAVAIERANVDRFRAFADTYRSFDDTVADRFEELALEEERHEALLTALFSSRFGTPMPKLDDADVAEVIESPDLDDGEHQLFDSLDPKRVFRLALAAERQAGSFYARAIEHAGEPELQRLYRELGAIEDEHVRWLEERIGEGGPP